MALQITHTKKIANQTVTFGEAYGQITADYGSKTERSLTLTIFADVTKTDILSVVDYTFIGSVEDNAPNFIKQGYEYLKTLQEFANAIDV